MIICPLKFFLHKVELLQKLYRNTQLEGPLVEERIIP